MKLYSFSLRVVTSKDKEKVRKWAKKEKRQFLWKDNFGVWHASTNKQNTPTNAAEIEEIKY